MLSQIPLKISEGNKNKQMLRDGIIAELDAVNLYEQMADNSKNRLFKKVMLDIAGEEKTHAGEFLDVLLSMDKEQLRSLIEGRKEIKKLRKVV
jgi:rubrerythrin